MSNNDVYLWDPSSGDGVRYIRWNDQFVLFISRFDQVAFHRVGNVNYSIKLLKKRNINPTTDPEILDIYSKIDLLISGVW